jgi:hypothetical protein
MFCGNGDELIINQFEKSGYGITRHNLGRKGSCQSYSINGMTKDLREAGVLGHKHIPNWYLRSSRNQRLALLQGLMDTDGFCGDSGTCEFCSMLPELADNVLELVISLGIRATLRTGQASVNGKKCGTKYRVMFTTSLPVFRLERKLNKRKTDIPSSRRRWRYIKSVSPVESVPVKCIGVDSDSHMFLCSKWMIPTHNTAALNQLALHLIGQGVKIMDISLEVKPGLTLYNMTRCAMAKRNGTKPEIDSCISWINESMYFLDCIGTVGVTRLMHAMEYARKRHGVDVFIIDSLFKCGLSSEDYGGQREFADKLTTFVNNTGAHVILVAHSRKVSTGNELSIPSKSDVAGSSDITNAAFNVIIWWRNKLKKRKLDELRSAGDTSSEVFVKWLAESDGKAVLDKQRFGEGEEAEVNVWFDKDSTQFHTVQDSRYPYFQKK